MPLWEEYLNAASLGGVELPIVRRRISGGWDGAKKELPHVNGAEFEPTGLRADGISIEVPLFEGMFSEEGSPLYPDRYEELISVLKDDTRKGRLEWVDPVWGLMDVQVYSWEIDETSEERDGARVSIRMGQVGFSTDEPDLQLSVLAQSDRGSAATNAEELDDALADAGITEADIALAWEDAGVGLQDGESASFAETFDTYVERIDAGEIRANEAEAIVAQPQARIRAVMSLEAARTSSAWRVQDRSMRLLAAVVEMAERELGTEERLVTWTVPALTTVYEIAARRYGDLGRVSEILQRNGIMRPLYIPAGTVLVLAEV